MLIMREIIQQEMLKDLNSAYNQDVNMLTKSAQVKTSKT